MQELSCTWVPGTIDIVRLKIGGRTIELTSTRLARIFGSQALNAGPRRRAGRPPASAAADLKFAVLKPHFSAVHLSVAVGGVFFVWWR
jgi:hypothetical protein